MKRTGFTLMELLLVVAILAIVAAAAAPTFTGGASEALAEARKSAFLSAYQNITSGANIMLSVRASKGLNMPQENLDHTSYNVDADVPNNIPEQHSLSFYVPFAARQFKNTNGQNLVLGAKYTNENKVVIGYIKGATKVGNDSTFVNITVTDDDSNMSQVLDAAWADIETYTGS